jgi:GNAT superfamily N-acetyltransferase
VDVIRKCRDSDLSAILAIINAGAEAYHGVIPQECWHVPYMPVSELREEIAAGVFFWGYEVERRLVGVMGIQQSGDVDFLRHAYVLPAFQRQGIGTQLIAHLRSQSIRPMLVGTWADAHWAIRFYQREGFTLLPREQIAQVLKKYWTISEHQAQASVVLTYGRFA